MVNEYAGDYLDAYIGALHRRHRLRRAGLLWWRRRCTSGEPVDGDGCAALAAALGAVVRLA